MRRVGHEACADSDQDTESCIELPWLLDRRGHEKPNAHQAHASPDDDSRAISVHEPAKDRGQDCGDQEAEGKGTGDKPSIPSELIDEWRQQQ
jgi:hypothetical protein